MCARAVGPVVLYGFVVVETARVAGRRPVWMWISLPTMDGLVTYL